MRMAHIERTGSSVLAGDHSSNQSPERCLWLHRCLRQFPPKFGPGRRLYKPERLCVALTKSRNCSHPKSTNICKRFSTSPTNRGTHLRPVCEVVRVQCTACELESACGAKFSGGDRCNGMRVSQ